MVVCGHVSPSEGGDALASSRTACIQAAWLIGSAASLTNWVFVLLGVVGALLLLEFCWPAWPRYRRIVLTCATLFFQSAVLVGITTLAIAACLAAPMFGRGQ